MISPLPLSIDSFGSAVVFLIVFPLQLWRHLIPQRLCVVNRTAILMFFVRSYEIEQQTPNGFDYGFSKADAGRATNSIRIEPSCFRA